MSHGMNVTGCSTSNIETMRSTAFACLIGATVGKSRTLALMCEKDAGPILRATLLPVLTLCRAIWE
eukprot:7199191-Pyramimonas_sp.AAC.1